MSNWIPLEQELPPENKVIQCTTESGDVRELIFQRGLFWLPDMSMYVYFTPLRWFKE